MGQGSCYQKKKNDFTLGHHWGKGNGRSLIVQTTSLTKKLQIECFKVTFLGEVEAATSKVLVCCLGGNIFILRVLFPF